MDVVPLRLEATQRRRANRAGWNCSDPELVTAGRPGGSPVYAEIYRTVGGGRGETL